MKTDTWYYQLIQTLPALPFQLMGLPIPTAPYKFEAVELKEFKFRLDGLLIPTVPEPDLPILFIEAQMQPDPNLYYRIGNQLMTYLKQYHPPQPWATLIIYPDPTIECPIPHLERFLAFANIHRVYLNQIPPDSSFGIELLRLVVAPPEEVIPRGQDLVNQLRSFEPILSQQCLELVTELINRKFPDAEEEEIGRMLGLVELEQTKAYQQGLARGEGKGKQEGKQEGKREVAAKLLGAGMPIAQVATFTDLSESELRQMQNDLEQNNLGQNNP
jgi:predicted transposase/invertase (TIGR01784 family)